MTEKDVIGEFSLTREQLLDEAGRVEAALSAGLRGEPSPFLFLPSFLGLPGGREEGDFFALDFGGSNLRLAHITLRRGFITQNAARKWPLKELSAAAGHEVDALFFDIARKISDFAGQQGGFLGHTFSHSTVVFPGAHDARAHNWTKEISFAGAQNINVNGLLRQKLLFIGRGDIVPAVILNDATAVLLASAYQSGKKNIVGSVCGTGHNSCYYEPDRKMAINLETGNFSPACRNRFDQELDLSSSRPGGQLMEKMTAGDYLAKLASLAARALGVGVRLERAVELSAILDGAPNALAGVVRAIVKRAAALTAAEYSGISLYLAHKGEALEEIFIDGAIYNEMPLFRQELNAALAKLGARPPETLSGRNSSLFGAAVACALASGSDLPATSGADEGPRL
ncbi:MAG: hypothetical protein LBO03_00705 [Acidaminococcales bacterium]|jgi:hexokinase|nr:hypothetical protein [Acidaminococcales bacterium]